MSGAFLLCGQGGDDAECNQRDGGGKGADTGCNGFFLPGFAEDRRKIGGRKKAVEQDRPAGQRGDIRQQEQQQLEQSGNHGKGKYMNKGELENIGAV